MNLPDISFPLFAAVTFCSWLLGTILIVVNVKRTKSMDESDCMTTIYDVIWVLSSIGTLFLLYLVVGGHQLRMSKWESNFQQENEVQRYVGLLQTIPLTEVCTEVLPVPNGQTKQQQSVSRDNACLWAKTYTSNAKQLLSLTKFSATSCSNDNTTRTLETSGKFNGFKSCVAANSSACARALCDYDVLHSSVTNGRFIDPMPTEFNGARFVEFRKAMTAAAPTTQIDSNVHKRYRPMSQETFSEIWIWVISFCLGLRLAKASYDVYRRWPRPNQGGDRPHGCLCVPVKNETLPIAPTSEPVRPIEVTPHSKPVADDVSNSKEIAPVAASNTLKLFHGSPHAFSEFSLINVGKNDGGDALGYGLYLAEEEKVAAKFSKRGYMYDVEIEITNDELLTINSSGIGQHPVHGRIDYYSLKANAPTTERLAEQMMGLGIVVIKDYEQDDKGYVYLISDVKRLKIIQMRQYSNGEFLPVVAQASS